MNNSLKQLYENTFNSHSLDRINLAEHAIRDFLLKPENIEEVEKIITLKEF
jgi:hypothetical protein